MTDEEIAEDMIEEMEKDLDKVIKYEEESIYRRPRIN